MKNKKHHRAAAAVAKSAPGTSLLPYFAALGAVLAVFWAYAPAVHGPFLFDDTILPFALPGFTQPLIVWMRGVRPILMFSYWINARISGGDSFSYHVFNVLIHCVTTGLVFFIVRRLLEWSQAPNSRRTLLAAFAAGLFLLHPAQSEAVAYLAGRSEALSTLFALLAFTIFLYRRNTAISWVDTAFVLVVFGLALLTKEQTIAIPALLLLTDFWWNPGFRFSGIKDNWRLYGPMALGAAGGIVFYWGLILNGREAGFGLKDLTWYHYFFTQWRALFYYIGMFVFPANLTVDWDFSFSRTPLEHGAIFGLLALLALAAAAWHYRRRFPLAGYGFFVYLTLMAPTSSILPIRDAIAERRLYFSSLGLLLILVAVLAHLKVDRKALAWGCAAVLLVAAVVTHTRAEVWSDPVLLWSDTVRKSPNKGRAHFQLAQAYAEEGQYGIATAEFEKASKLDPATYNLMIDWGLALDNAGNTEAALEKLQAAAKIDATAHVYSQIGMVYAKRQRWQEALAALATAEKIDPQWPTTYLYRAKIRLKTNDPQAAIQDYNRVLSIEPRNREAREEVTLAQRMLQANQVKP